MIVTAWNNGKHHESGAGSGFKLHASDRDRNIRRNWRTVIVVLPDGKHLEANVDKPSFWSDSCREVISKEFGVWLRKNGHTPWPKGGPPKFQLTQQSANHFKLSGI